MFNTQQYALVKNAEGNFVYGEGPFTSSDEPAESGVSFYLNNYDLTNQNPWLIPNSWRLLDKTDLINFQNNSTNQLYWNDPSLESFEVQFNDIKKSIKGGFLKKTVPVVSSTARTDDQESLMRSLIIKGAFFPGINAVHITISIFFNVSESSCSCFFLKSSVVSFA